jgi:hypothetical protein
MLSLTTLTQAASLTINQPRGNEKVVLTDTYKLPVQATFEIPEKPQKKDEAVIVWTIKIEGKTITAQSKSGETVSMNLVPSGYLPFLNDSFGPNTVTATINKVQFLGNGGYQGPGALQAVVMENTGRDYRGYILASSDPSSQDIVIGDDTSGLPGCVYEIAGYCTEPSKNVPSQNSLFGAPWTSNDPQHWAYWVRRAVIYGSDHQDSYTPSSILDSVWDIVNGNSYSSNGLLEAIGYPDTIPPRPNENNPSQPTTEFSIGSDAHHYRLNWKNPIDTDIVEVLLLGSATGETPSRLEDLTDYDVLGIIPAGDPGKEQSALVAMRGLSDVSGESSQTMSQVFSQDYALCVLDEDGKYSDLVWARLRSPLLVNSWNLNLVPKNSSKNSLAVKGEIISSPGSLDPGKNGFSLTTTRPDGYGLISWIEGGAFVKKSRGRYIFRKNGMSADLLVNIGGSSRTKFKMSARYSGFDELANASPVRIDAQSGDFSAPVDVKAHPKGSGKNRGKKGSVFALGNQPYISSEMFINSFRLKRVLDQEQQDELRFVCRIVGTTFPGSGSRRLTLYYLDEVLTIADDMWESQSNGRMLVFRQESSEGRLLVKFNTVTGILSFYGSKMNVPAQATEDDVFKVGMASELFIKQNEITCSVSGSSTKRTFSY